jgi:hypothetical protein
MEHDQILVQINVKYDFQQNKFLKFALRMKHKEGTFYMKLHLNMFNEAHSLTSWWQNTKGQHH